MELKKAKEIRNLGDEELFIYLNNLIEGTKKETFEITKDYFLGIEALKYSDIKIDKQLCYEVFYNIRRLLNIKLE